MSSKPSIIPLLLPEDELLCSICQILIKDPVTTPCGHNFCKACITKHWGKISSPFYCPHCRRKFLSKPDLQPNTVLCSIMEHVVKVWAEPEHLSTLDEKCAKCDVCEEGRKLPAVKTCTTCLASFCSVHVMPHTDSKALMKHCLCAPVADVKELQCKKHGKVLELFCVSHTLAVCWQCSAKHRNCKIRTVEEMKQNWKGSTDPVAKQAEDRKDSTSKALEALDTLSEGVQAAAEKMKEDIEICFKALRDTIDCAQERVTAFIEAEKTGALQHIEEQEKLLNNHMLAVSHIMNQITECKSNDSYFNFCLPLPQLPPPVRQFCNSDVQLDGRAVERIVLDLQHLNSSLESQLCATLERREELRDKDLALDDFKVVRGNSKRRHKLLQYSCGVTFDPITASASVLLSEDSLAVTVEHNGLIAWKDYQVNMEMGFRVLCSQNFTRGQHYWEVSPPEDLTSNWAVGVTYKHSQERYQCLGQDKSSWCVRWQNAGETKDKNNNCENIEETGGKEAISVQVQCKEGPKCVEVEGPKLESEDANGREHPQKSEGQKLEKENKNITGFFASHNHEMYFISQKPPRKIGVHLDCDRGWLSFFTVSDFRVKLCYRFDALLSAPLFPAVWLRDPEKTITISKEVCTVDSCRNCDE